jgi:serine/threonine protein phosphatase PrpC
MITCPECGESAADGAKFCDRCGRGLDPASPPSASSGSLRPPALAPGACLEHGYEIIAVLSGSSIENRYRARRSSDQAAVILRERTGPQVEGSAEPAEPADTAALETSPPPDPSGPHAKTAELSPAAVFAASPAPAASMETAGAVAESVAPGAAADVPRPAASGSAEHAGQNGAGDGDGVGDGAAPSFDDLGEIFGRVLALSMTLNHPAFQRALCGFSEDGRVYLAYADENLSPVAAAGERLGEPEAIAAAIQVAQAISFVHRRGLRVNDICPQSVARDAGGRIRLTGLDCVTNDNEQAAEPLFNDGYTAPEIYRARRVDKRADVFSAGALLYTWLTGERVEVESWREESGPIRFYPPHVISPELEQAVRRALLFDPKDRWKTIDEFKAELARLLGAIRMRAATLTDVGMVRELNEDSVMALEFTRDSLVAPAQHYLYAVCDGMGGAEAGETASAIAVGAIRDYVENGLKGADAVDLCTLMTAALEEANRRILEYQAAHPESRGMGSTGVAMLAMPPNAGVAWVGDSRAYLLENGALRQVTRDHSLVQRLVEIGQITPEEARTHEHKNVITRSLGARQSGPAGAEAVAVRLKRGDRMVLCSDGLTAHVADPEIMEILRRHPDPYDSARELICAANAGGGTDNISVIVVFAS